MSENFKPHLFIKNVHISQSYTTPPSGGGGDANLPEEIKMNMVMPYCRH